MLLPIIPLLLISSVFTSYPYHHLTHKPQVYPSSNMIQQYSNIDSRGYQQSRPYSVPVAMNNCLSSALAPFHSQYHQTSIIVPISQVVMSTPTPVCIYSSSQSASIALSEVASNENLEFMKLLIYDSIRFNRISRKNTPIDINNFKSLIFELRDSKTSKSIAGEIHLNWFIEFACSLFQSKYRDSLVDYFDYIKEFHLIKEIHFNPYIAICIDISIAKLIQNECILAEVISQLVEIVGKGMDTQRANYHYATLKASILENEYNLTKTGHARYSIVLESFLEFIPHLPFHIVLLDRGEYRFGHLRLALHFAYFYEMLMGFRDCILAEVRYAINQMFRYIDGTSIDIYTFDFERLRFQVLDRILKRLFLRIVHSDSTHMDTIFLRFDLVANEFVKSLNPDLFKTFIKGQMNYLLDFYIYFTLASRKLDIDFVDFVVTSYSSITTDTDRYFSMQQIAIYLSHFEMTLSHFRGNFKSKILDLHVDGEFVLVLETIIAAIEGIESKTAYYETWEPSMEFLLLQSQIILSPKDYRVRYQIVDSPYLILAAKIYLSRQTSFPISIFFTSNYYNDSFSWSDALNFVNFYFEHIFIGSAKYFKVKSQFFEDLGKDFDESPTLDQMIFLHNRGQYENLKRTISPEIINNKPFQI